MKYDYIVVTACRNENPDELDRHIKSVLTQTIKPKIHIVIDDMSENPIYSNDCIVIKSNQPRYKIRGINISKALNMGIHEATNHTPEWLYLLNLDVDTVIPPSYAEDMIKYLKLKPIIGTSSGVSNHMGRLQQSHKPSNAARMWTRECWETIGGFKETHGFDTLATFQAIYHGYKPSINTNAYFIESRPSNKKTLSSWILDGRTRSSWGFPLWHTCLAAAKNMFNGKPPIIGPIFMVIAHFRNHYEKTMLPSDWCNTYAKYELKKMYNRTCAKK